MAQVKNQRRDPRVPLVLRVDYPASPEAARDATENLSAGGLFIRTEQDLQPGERLPLLISFPGLLEPVEVEVEVVRQRRATGEGPAGLAVKIPIDRIDERRKLARLAETARTAHGAPRQGYRVLVVEDDPDVVEMYEYALRKVPAADVEVAVEFASNGHEALQRLAERPRVDLVMSDLHMPVMDGFTLFERMRSDARLRAIPVLAISSADADSRRRAIELGADVYLQKPVPFADILQTVRTLLRIQG